MKKKEVRLAKMYIRQKKTETSRLINSVQYECNYRDIDRYIYIDTDTDIGTYIDKIFEAQSHLMKSYSNILGEKKMK